MHSSLLLVFAFVFFIIATFWNPGLPPTAPWHNRVHVGWLGLACWVASILFSKS